MEAGDKERRLSNLVSLVLKLGISISVVLVGVSLILLIATGQGKATAIPPADQLVSRVLRLDPLAIITLGILIILLTPCLQVIVAAVNFIINREKLYLTISLTLLLFLTFSFILAFT